MGKIGTSATKKLNTVHALMNIMTTEKKCFATTGQLKKIKENILIL